MSARKIVATEAQRTLQYSISALVPYFEDPLVTEIMVNSAESVFIERGGSMTRLEVKIDDRQIETAIRSIMTINSKDTSHIMDARLPSLRIAAALPPVAIHGPLMAIRKHATRRYTLDDYVASGAFTPIASDQGPALGHLAASEHQQREMEDSITTGGEKIAAFFRWCATSRKNVMLVGGTGSGKTTLMSAFLMAIPKEQRVITCEDTNELTLDQDNSIQLEANPLAGITIRDLIKLNLRLRPDRIIVGEVRGPEASDLLDAMNTGHPGTAFTIHSDSAFAGLARLENLLRMAPQNANLPHRVMRQEVASAIDYVVYQSRLLNTRGPEQIIALEKTLSPEGEYRWRSLYDRLHLHRSARH